MHIDGDHCGPLGDWQLHQCLPDHDRGLHLCGSVGNRNVIIVIECGRGPDHVAPQSILAGVHHDTVQPTAHRRVIPEGPGAAVHREHGLLDGVVGVLGGLAAPAGEAVKLGSVPPEQFREGVAVAAGMGAEQVCVGADGSEVGGWSGHRSDVSQPEPGRHFTPAAGQEAARTLISETSVRLLPPVCPRVDIHTSR